MKTFIASALVATAFAAPEVRFDGANVHFDAADVPHCKYENGKTTIMYDNTIHFGFHCTHDTTAVADVTPTTCTCTTDATDGTHVHPTAADFNCITFEGGDADRTVHQLDDSVNCADATTTAAPTTTAAAPYLGCMYVRGSYHPPAPFANVGGVSSAKQCNDICKDQGKDLFSLSCPWDHMISCFCWTSDAMEDFNEYLLPDGNCDDTALSGPPEDPNNSDHCGAIDDDLSWTFTEPDLYGGTQEIMRGGYNRNSIYRVDMN
jgi:hypothetical protein